MERNMERFDNAIDVYTVHEKWKRSTRQWRLSLSERVHTFGMITLHRYNFFSNKFWKFFITKFEKNVHKNVGNFSTTILKVFYWQFWKCKKKYRRIFYQKFWKSWKFFVENFGNLLTKILHILHWKFCEFFAKNVKLLEFYFENTGHSLSKISQIFYKKCCKTLKKKFQKISIKNVEEFFIKNLGTFYQKCCRISNWKSWNFLPKMLKDTH